MDIEKKKILIVEDEDDSRFFMAKKLESCGYHVFQAANGREGLKIAQDQFPDLIITDVLMPRMGGGELIKELQRLHSCKDIPVIVITVRKNMKDYFDSMGVVASFIPKPFSPETLVMQVDDILKQPKRELIDAPKKILVAGSHAECVENISELLRNDEYHVDFVTSSEQIISKAVLFLPNIFIFQTRMYGVQASYEVVKILRQMPQFKRSPILLYSVYNADSKKKSDDIYQEKLTAISFANRCMDEGANEYIGKFDENIFLECVSKYLKKGTIIAIDDDKGVLVLLKNKLEAEGYKILTAMDGDSGIQLVKYTRPNLILLDIVMPGMDGYEVLGVLKQDPMTWDIPVIMLTVKGADNEIQKALNLGAKDYIVKPFHIELLMKRIENHLEIV